VIAPVFNPTWPEDVQALYQHDLQEIWDPTIVKHIWNQYHNQLALYMSLLGSCRRLEILDVGCAQATLALLLAERGHTVTAVDLRQQFLDYAKSRYERGEIQFVCGDAMHLDLAKRYDLIFANQIMEHLVYPVDFLRGLARLLKSDGKIVMTTPNFQYIRNSLPSFSELGNPAQYCHMQSTADGDGHFFAYSEMELRDIVTAAQLALVETRHFESPFISGHAKFRYFHRLLPTALLRLLDRAALGIPWAGVRLAHQLMVVARKPQ
jgi:2-polyprenyl-3-methyl-5-hydroxy-6-metoxy-1,4-benzoquinol methylase